MRNIFFLLQLLLMAKVYGQTNGSEQPNPEKSFLITDGIVLSKPINTLHGTKLVFTQGDSILVTSVEPGNQQQPEFVAVVPKMFSFAMRGPQATATKNGIVVAACTEDGDIFCFKQTGNAHWKKTATINKPATAKEGLMSLASEGDKLVAVWLNALPVKGQSIYAGFSTDGGESWTRREIYTSPDGTTCECCKPSVSVRDGVVYVMFRNWVNGNRDMHIMKSEDGGVTFSKAEQVGTGNWKLNGCPMDGGDLQINAAKQPVTIWRREGKLYTSLGSGNETFLAEGKNGSVQPSGSGNSYAWVDKGIVIVKTADGRQHRLGEGSAPKLETMTDGRLLCTWQKDKSIFGWLGSSDQLHHKANP